MAAYRESADGGTGVPRRASRQYRPQPRCGGIAARAPGRGDAGNAERRLPPAPEAPRRIPSTGESACEV